MARINLEDEHALLTSEGQKYYCFTKSCYAVVANSGEKCFDCNDLNETGTGSLSATGLILLIPVIIFCIWTFWK